MYGEYPNYLPLDVLWGTSKVRPKLSVVGMIIPIINCFFFFLSSILQLLYKPRVRVGDLGLSVIFNCFNHQLQLLFQLSTFQLLHHHQLQLLYFSSTAL
jgi:hypothetical protein